MFYNRQTSLRLHEEHLATVQAWSRLEQITLLALHEAQVVELRRLVGPQGFFQHGVVNQFQSDLVPMFLNDGDTTLLKNGDERPALQPKVIAWKVYGQPEFNSVVLIDENARIVAIEPIDNLEHLADKAEEMGEEIDFERFLIGE